MKIAIVDDSAQDAATVRRLCREWAETGMVEVELGCYESGELFLDAFMPGMFDLVLMDIYMSGVSGLETARRLRQQDPACLLAFLTSSSEHMAEAFPCHVFDYVLKPIRPERLHRVLTDAQALLPQSGRFIRLPGAHGGERIPLGELVSAESDGNYIVVSTADGSTHRCRMTFTELSRMLEGNRQFLSTIRGVILNMDYIVDLSDRRCVMKTGAVYPVKVRDGAEIVAVLDRYRLDSLRTRQERSRP